MNLLLRPAYFNPVPYRPKFRLEQQQQPDEAVDWRIDDDDTILAVIVAIAD